MIHVLFAAGLACTAPTSEDTELPSTTQDSDTGEDQVGFPLPCQDDDPAAPYGTLCPKGFAAEDALVLSVFSDEPLQDARFDIQLSDYRGEWTASLGSESIESGDGIHTAGFWMPNAIHTGGTLDVDIALELPSGPADLCDAEAFYWKVVWLDQQEIPHTESADCAHWSVTWTNSGA
ncbi:MAG: hypothetical protein VX899_18770 [Myxococcota bacterium]|nr:hypothetical protein [Myxococcota bacterium]